MSRSKNIVIIGDAAVDTIVRLPESGTGIETLKDIEAELSAGGAVGNTAIALTRLSLKVSLAFAVGADGYGDFLKQTFVEAGVDVSSIEVVPDRFTLNVIVIIDRSGERYFAVHPTVGSASMYYPPNKLDLTSIAQARWLHTSGSSFEYGSTREAIIKAMEYARNVGIPVSLDLNLRPRTNALTTGYREAVRSAIDLADYVFGSAKDEIVFYTGIDNAVEAARALANGKRTVIARSGSRGCVVITSSGDSFHSPAFKVKVVDTLGAGDVFDAGFIAAKLENKSVMEAAQWGNALASLSVAAEGVTQYLARESLERMLHFDN